MYSHSSCFTWYNKLLKFPQKSNFKKQQVSSNKQPHIVMCQWLHLVVGVKN